MSTRIAAASGKYVSQVKDRLSDIGSTTRRAAPIISAIKTRMKKTDDPFTQVGSQKSYTPQESSPAPQSEGLGDIAGAAQDAVQGGLERIKEARKKRKDKRINKIEKKLKFPVVVKPINEGSSVNVFICSRKNIIKNLKKIECYKKVMIEKIGII